MSLDLFARYDQLGGQLGRLFNDLRVPNPGGRDQMLALASDVQAMVADDPDAAIGALHLVYDVPYNIEHPISSAILCQLLAEVNGLDADACSNIVAAGLSHDIGMIYLQELLERHLNPLTDSQREKIRTHPLKGKQMLISSGVDDQVWLDAIAQHHERLDGSGYPQGLRGDQVELSARIVAVADVYSALVRHRGFRKGYAGSAALREMLVTHGEGLDQQQIKLLIKVLGVYPPGVLVRLDSGEIAIVVRRGSNAHKPHVCAIISDSGEALAAPVHYDCGSGQREVKSELAGNSGAARQNLDLSRVWSVVSRPATTA